MLTELLNMNAISNPKEFLNRFATTNEPWIHHYTPKSHEGNRRMRSSNVQGIVRTVPTLYEEVEKRLRSQL